MSETSRTSARVAFWSNEIAWADDTPAYVFLARVVHRVGKILFGNDWTGLEPQAEPLHPLPEWLDTQVDSSQLRRACRLLYDGHEPYKARCPEFAVYLERWPIPDPSEWALARQISVAQHESERQSLNRFLEVLWRLSAAFKEGSINTATRDFDGGRENVQEPFFWNTENNWPRFCTCQINPQEPYARAVISHGGAFIFVERRSLEKALTPPRAETVGEPEPSMGVGYLSPYVRCMIRTSHSLRITPENQPKVASLEAEFSKYWDGPGDLSGRDKKAMATLVRDPQSKDGRARRTRT